MKECPLVSVIVPTYNRAWCIERTIRSILSQSYKDFELIVVDNRSTDGTVDRINRINDSRIRIVEISNGGIVAKSRNTGIRHSHGKYIAFLDSDDIWHPEKLERCVGKLESGADICFHWMSEIGNEKPMDLTRRLTKPILHDLIANGNAVATSSVVVSRKAFIEIGMFSEDRDLIAIEDYDAWVRLSRVTERFECIECILGGYTIGVDGLLGGSESSTRRRKALEGIKNKHYMLHKSVLGYTPGWLLNALARQYLAVSLRKATSYNIECIRSKASMSAKTKAATIQALVLFYYARAITLKAYMLLKGSYS